MPAFPEFDGKIEEVKDLQSLLAGRAVQPHSHLRFWFRGQADHTWIPQPKLTRFDIDWNTEKHLTQDFQVLGASLLADVDQRSDIYFLEQHYGMPTRLLDWSQNPLVGLYFAVSNSALDNVDGRLLSLDAYQGKDKRTVDKFEFHGIATYRNPAFIAALKPIFEWHDDKSNFPNFIIPVRPDHRGGRVNYLSIYQFSRHPQSFGSGRHLRRSFMAQRRPRVNQESLPRASLAG